MTSVLPGLSAALAEASQEAPVRALIVEDLADLERFTARWDELAVASSRPFCSPGWMLAWWRHLAPARSGLQVVMVLLGDELLGVAPLFFQRRFGGLVHLRFLGSGTSYRLEPLARPGWEPTVARMVVEALSTSRHRPHVVSFEGVPADSPWPRHLAEAWVGAGPWSYRVRSLPAPTLTLHGRTYEDWLASRSGDWRRSIRRRRRQLEEQGGRLRLAASEEELLRDLSSFAALHYERWKERGGSRALDPRVELMLADAARQLGDRRFRIWCVDVDGATVSSQILVEAGGEVGYWLGGFDERWSRYAPATLTILASLEDAFARGDRRVDFGGGSQEYKYRLADGEDSLEWVQLVARGPRYPLTRLQLVPGHCFWRTHAVLTKKLSQETLQRLETLLGEATKLLRRLRRRS